MRRIFLTAPMILLIAYSLSAQTIKEIVSVPADAVGREAGIVILFESYRPLPSSVTDLSKYTLFGFSPERMTVNNDDLTPYLRAAVPTCDLFGGICEIRSTALANRLDATKNYILGIDDLKTPGRREILNFKLAEKGAIKNGPGSGSSRKTVQVVAPVAITDYAGAASVVLERERLEIGPGSFYVRPAPRRIGVTFIGRPLADPLSQNKLTLTLANKLGEGAAHSLRVSRGIVSQDTRRPIAAAGTVEFNGLPSNPDAPKISAFFGSNAGVGQKAFFDLRFDFKPKNAFPDGTDGGTWKPNLSVDVGLRSTKSANSIIFSFVRANTYSNVKKRSSRPQAKKLRNQPSRMNRFVVEASLLYRTRL